MKHVLLVFKGSDIPGITQDILYEALEKLEDNEMVLGPAADGGYYLVGMSRKCEQHLGEYRLAPSLWFA